MSMRWIVWAVVVLALMAIAPDVFAQSSQKAGDVATNISGQAPAIGKAIKVVMYLVGFGLIGMGFTKWVSREKYNTKTGEIALPIVIGGLLLSLLTVSDIVSNSTVDQASEGVDALQLRDN